MKYFEYPKKNRYFFRFSSKSRFAIPSLFFRSSSVDPPYQSRCKVGAKSVKERS